MAWWWRGLIWLPCSYVAQILNALGVNVNFVFGTAGEFFQLFNNDSLGAMAAVQKGGNYRNTHASGRGDANPGVVPVRWPIARRTGDWANGIKSPVTAKNRR